MKNNVLFLIAAISFALISCGTTNQVAYSGSSNRYSNSIYYNPSNTEEYQNYAQQTKQLKQLQDQTSAALENSTQYSTYNSDTKTETIYVGNSNEVNIDYNPNITYSIIDDQESYEARLRKFDSPTYTINIETDLYDYYNPWWRTGYYYGPYYGAYYSPYYYRRYYSWNWYRPWYDPFYDPWYNPWYAYGPYYPWYYPGYYPGHYHPGYHPDHHPGHHPGPGVGPGPGAKPSHGHNGVYYGKRTVNSNYNTNSQRGTVVSPSQSTNGSKVQGSTTRNTQSRYTRRSTAASSSKGNTTTVNRGTNSRNNSSSTYYRRSSSSASSSKSAIRQSSSSYRSNSHVGSASSYSGGSGSSNQGGSAYRRR